MPTNFENKFRSDLLNKQLANAQLVRKRTPPKKGVPASKSTGIQYNTQLQKLVKQIKLDINEHIVSLVRDLEPSYMLSSDSAITLDSDSATEQINTAFQKLQDKYNSPEFASVYSKMASDFIVQANDVNQEKFNKQMKSFGLDIYGTSPSLSNYLDASIADNVQLITSIPSQYLDSVQSIVRTNMRSGLRSSAMTAQLQKQFSINKNRAVVIARDQTAKANGQLNQQRQVASGFTYFKWLDTEDSKVRTRHRQIADQVTPYGVGVYKWSKPPVNDNGQPIVPGQDYNCRCTAQPITDEQVAQYRKENKNN